MALSGDSGRAAIVGGGVAGLVTAYYLGKAGVKVDLFESEAETGGLARSFDFDGMRTDIYYHFICLPDAELIELAEELGIAGKLQWRPTLTNFFYEGKLYPFTTPLDLLQFSPLPFSSRVKVGLEALRWKNLEDWKPLDDLEAADWLKASLGEKAYEVIWSPLLTMKFGDYFDKISAAWVWHRVHRVSRSRKGLLGAQVMGHFRGGTETLLGALRERIATQGGKIFCGSPVEAVKASSGRVKSVVVSGTERDYESVVLSAPLPISAQLLPAELADYRAGLERVSFIGVACILAWLDQPVTDAFWCNINDSRIPFNGIIEMSRLNLETGRGGALVYVPHYVRTSSPRFSLPDDKLIEEFAQALALIKPGMGRKSIRSFRVFRTRFAQPIFSIGFRKIQPRHETPLKGMFLIDATQLYPVDRTVSGTIAVAREASRLVLKHLESGR